MSDGLRVDMLPAGHGDALWIEWGEGDDVHRMLIDGGTRATFDHLRERIAGLPEGRRKIDLLVISHIDLDHIDGVIKLLRTPSLDVRFADIWFNDFHHLPGAGPAGAGNRGEPTRGGLQGEFLAAVLDDHDLPWNMAFDRGAVVVPETGPLPEITLEGGLNLVLVSPLPANLERLRERWAHEVADANLNPGDRARALELLEERLGPAGASRGERLTFGGDGSEANGSSIAFVAEYGEQRWLFAADAHEDVLRAGLQRYAETRGGLPVRLDGFKLPHHGSVKNISPELLDMVDAATYLISTNGAYFHHPDAACIDLILEKTGSKQPELVFNYRSDFTSKWEKATFLFDADRGDGPSSATAGVAAAATAPRSRRKPARPAVQTTDVTICAVHGSLDRADWPVVVGHYTATSLDGAEGHIDRRFGGRLSSRHALGEYPGEIGTHLYVLAPLRAHPSNGVIVVGLGEYGALTPRLLATTVRMALVAHALDRADASPPRRQAGRGEDRPIDLGISTVALGATGGQGLSIRTSVRAILDGLLAANESLRQGGRPRAQYTRLELWERRAREAELTLLALVGRPEAHLVDHAGEDLSLDPDALPPGVAVEADLKVADGHLTQSLPADEERRPWQRIRVRAPTADRAEPGSFLDLTFSADGGLAAVGEQTHRVERRRLDRLLAGSSEVAGSEDGLHTTLFELLLPNDLKWDLRAARDIQLEVDDTTADIPWEMLAARDTGTDVREPLALRASFIRQLRTDPPTNIMRAGRPRALVIGNPPAGHGWPSLPGAYEEAVAVVATLEQAGLRGLVSDEHCYAADRATDDAITRAIEDALFAHEYRIIHIAGHGFLDPDDEARTGVVIGPDAFITAQTIGQLQPVPDLVFLNCCHLGQVGAGGLSGGEHTRLGASLARRLIRSGVRAVVAAGWAVDDAAATAFATIFYEQMTRVDATFGEAVRSARLAAHLASPQSTTWGAYQCYGDSGLRLHVNRSTPPPLPPLTPREVLRRVELVIGRYDSMIGAEEADYGMEYIRQELAALTGTARRRGWLEAGDGGLLAEALGSAHAEIGDFETAIEWYELALRHPGGRASLRTVEQVANLRDRLAARLGRTAGPADRGHALALADEAQHGFDVLAQLGRTSERTALLAGHHKRQAVATTGKRRISALRRAADCYLEAVADASPTERHYPLFNFIQADEIRSRLTGDASRVTAEHMKQARAGIRRLDRTAPSVQSFWNAAGRGDGRLAEAVALDAVPARLTRLVDVYLEAFNRRSTARQRSSVLEHLADLAELHPDPDQEAALIELRARLEGTV